MSTDTRSVDLVGDELVVNVARAAVLASLTGAFAYVSFPHPVSPVPITLQVLGVFLAGILLGPLWGGVAMAVYVVAGAVGAPVYAFGSAGFGELVGPYGGYLWSYPVAAAALGLVVHGTDGLTDLTDAGVGRLVAGLFVATVVIYAFGTAGYAIVQGVGPAEAFLVAAVAFVPFEVLKGAAAIGIVRSDALAAD